MQKHRAGRKLTDSQFAWLLVLPALTVFILIILYPFINSLIMSFTDQSLLFPGRKFVGLANFTRVFGDPNFFEVLWNTLIFVVVGTIVPFILGFIWAIILNQGFKGSELLRGLTLINWIIPSTAIGFLWMWIFHGQFGLLNAFLKALGLIRDNINWLGQARTAMPVVLLAKTWQTLPWFMAFLLGGLQGVSYDQIEAARIDGAGNIQVFRHVVVPEMKPIITLVLLLGAIGSLQHFDLIWVMTQGGPARATTTLSVEVYRSAFHNWKLGVAAAVGTVWVLAMTLVSFFYLKSLRLDLE